MRQPVYFIFDLDGTLLDTATDLANSVNYALSSYGLPTHELATVISFIGSGSLNLIRRSMGLKDEQCDPLASEIHRVFLEHYLHHCTVQTKPYPGVCDFLDKPHRASLLTNKSLAPTLVLLRHFGWENRFEHVLCGDTSPERKPSPAGLLWILEQVGIHPQDALMVGDDMADVHCAQAAGVPCVAILSGFGNAALLRNSNANFLADSFLDFTRLVQAS